MSIFDSGAKVPVNRSEVIDSATANLRGLFAKSFICFELFDVLGVVQGWVRPQLLKQKHWSLREASIGKEDKTTSNSLLSFKVRVLTR